MKKTLLIIFVLIAGLGLNAHAQATAAGLMEVRDKVLKESQEIKALFSDTKDVILVSSMVDSCILTTSQLDAYFSQLGIFNTIKKNDVSPDAINFLEQWLNNIKSTNDLNIKSLSAVTQNIQAKTKLHLERLTGYFTDLNAQIEQELAQLAALKKALGI